MLVAGIDFETTGLDCEKDHIIEIGAVIWDTERNKPIEIMSRLVKLPDGISIPAEIEKLTGIGAQDLWYFGRELSQAAEELILMLQKADFMVAHNAPFDRGFYDCHIVDEPDQRLWIDTCADLPIADGITTRKLNHLCAEHGFLNPFPHRAVFDVMATLKLMSCYPFAEVLSLARTPTARLQACVSFDDRDKAKARGYRWDAAARVWVKSIKENKVEQETKDAGFPVRRIS